MDNCGNSRANTCIQAWPRRSVVFSGSKSAFHLHAIYRGNLCVVRHVGNCRFVTADSLLDLYSPPRNEKTRGSGTAAGFVPKPWQTLAIKTAERYLRNPLNTKLDLLSSWHIGQLFSSWLRRTAAKHPPTDSRKHLETRRLAEADQQQDSGPNQAKH